MNTRVFARVVIAAVFLSGSIGAAASASSDRDEAALEVVRQLTKEYHDVTVAEADGFVQTDPCIPAMGLHYVNTARWDERLEPGRPEVVLYAPTIDGGRTLVGAEWVVTDDDQNLATDHDRPHLFGHDFQGPMPGHAPGQPIHYDLHAYAWVDNPLGGFFVYNPAVRCHV